MQIGVPKETAEGERRVALVPEVVRKLSGQGHEIIVQRGAGASAHIPDALYEEAGAKLVDDAGAVYAADVVVKVAAAERRGDRRAELRRRAHRLPGAAEQRRRHPGHRPDPA